MAAFTWRWSELKLVVKFQGSAKFHVCGHRNKRLQWNINLLSELSQEENFAVVKNHKYFHLRRIKFCGESYERRAMRLIATVGTKL